MHSVHSFFRIRRGMTLIELLVVAGLMVLLVAISMPVMRPVAEDRAPREAIRGLQNMIESAKIRAAKLGRPCGVALIPYSSTVQNESGASITTAFPSVCLKCEPVTCPPDYSGVTRISASGGVGATGSLTVTFTDVDTSLRAAGNRIRINGAGPWFQFTGGATGSTTVTSPAVAGVGYFEPFWLKNAQSDTYYPYTVRRAPVLNSNNAFAKALGMDPPLTFPRGIVVDLYCSGVGMASGSGSLTSSEWKNLVMTKTASGYPPIIILFQPGGEVELFHNGTTSMIPPTPSNTNDPTSKIYLLVGQWQRGLVDPNTRIWLASSDQKKNFQNPNSYWLVINPRTGVVTSAPNRPANDVITSREFAKTQIKGMGSK